MKLDLTDAALEDLREIREYTLRNWGERQENLYLEAMWARFAEILNDPSRFRPREDLFPGCKVAAQEKHIILFRVESDVLQIIRVLHSAMDINRHSTE
jgi:toxin ParE1/3/4